MTLVIMAAGIGSRFGGLKQIEPVGPNGEFIIDYSIYDAKSNQHYCNRIHYFRTKTNKCTS
jgi:choline kinase